MDKGARVKNLQRRLLESDIDAALLIHSRDVYYYAGTAQPCILVVTPSDYFLIVRRALDFVLNETWLENSKIIGNGSFKEARGRLNAIGINHERLGLEMDIVPTELFLKITGIFGGFQPVDVSGAIMAQRMQKDPGEVDLVRTACRIMKAGHDRVLEVLSEGLTELDLAAEVEFAHRKAGHEGILSFRNFDFYISRGPLSSGENLFKVSGFTNTITGTGLSPAVPAGPSGRKIKWGDLVVVDIPTCYHGYHCDETRTYVLGPANPPVADLFEALREISDTVIASLRDGVTCGEIFDAAYAHAQKLGVAEYFLGLPPRKANFVGHGIGLDANEPPVLFQDSSFILRSNFVLTVEIHLTHSQHGAVKLEDVVLVKENGAEILSVTPRDLFSI